MPHNVPLAALAAFGLAVAGCAGGPSTLALQSAPPALSEACEAFRFHPIALWIDAEVVRQGETVPIRAGSTLGRAAGKLTPDPMPTTCLTDWRITPEGAAVVSADGSSLTVAPDAPAGATLALEVRTPGEPARYATPIVGRDEVVLTGAWSQREVDCGDLPPPRQQVTELIFRPDGHFSVTWAPFETYTDYWGEFVHDVGADALRLKVTGANQNPPAPILEGGIEVSEDGRRMVLTGIDLGDGQQWVPDRRCRYVFGRSRPATAAPPARTVLSETRRARGAPARRPST